MNFWQIVKTVLAALFGVQSEKNRRRDFSAQSVWPFIVVGLILVGLFVGILGGIVSWVLTFPPKG